MRSDISFHIGYIAVQPEGFAETISLDFEQVDSIRVVSGRDSWVRFGRTFSPTIFYNDRAASNAEVVLQRNLNRNQAIEMSAHLRSVVCAEPVPFRINGGRELRSDSVRCARTTG